MSAPVITSAANDLTFRGIVKAIFAQVDVISLLFFILVVFLIWVLSKWQRDRTGDYANFDLSDVIMKNGRVSRDALFEWIGVISLTFVLLHQEFKDVLTDWFVAVYVAAVLAKGMTNIIKGTPHTPKDMEPPKPPEKPPEGG